MIKDLQRFLAVKVWIQKLRSGEWPARLQAAEKLGELKDRRAVEALIEALTGDRKSSGYVMALGPGSASDEQDRFLVKQAAAKALGSIGDPQATPALMAAFEDPMPSVQVEAVTAVGLIGGEAAIESLVVMLRSPYSEVRLAAVDALSRFGTTPVKWLVNALRREAFETRQAAAKTLGLIGGPKAVEALIKALRDPDYQVRREATEALVHIGKPAVDALIPMLQVPEVEARTAAITALGKIRNPLALEPLKQSVIDPDRGVRTAAWHALDLLAWPPAVTRQRIQREIEAGTYQRVVEEGPAAVEPLIETFRFADESTRERVAQALYEIGQPSAESLAAFLKDTDMEVRRLAAKILESVRWQPSASIQRVWFAVAKGRYEQVVAEGTEAVPPLAAMLNYPHEWDRELAAIALGKIRHPNVVPRLAEALKDPAPKVRKLAAQALGETGDKLALAALRAASEDQDFNVRSAVLAAIQKLGSLDSL